MTRSFSYEVVDNGYKIWIDNVLTIVQTGFMPYVDDTIPVGTTEYYTKCAELNIAELQKADTEAENYVTSLEQTQEDVVSAMIAITELYETILG